MEITFYFYTILIILLCIAAATCSTCSYLLTRNYLYIPLIGLFVFYFIDLIFIFQNEYFVRGDLLTEEMFYGINFPLIKLFLSAATLECMWTAVCIYIDEKRPPFRFGPVVLFLIVGIGIIYFMPEGKWRQWCFYSIREAFLIWIMSYIVVRYRHSNNTVLKDRLKRHKSILLITAILCLCIIVENTGIILLWQPSNKLFLYAPMLYISERNLSENILITFYSLLILYHSLILLKSRRGSTPSVSQPEYEHHLEIIIDSYCDTYKLTKREHEILHLILLGKDYQNIASTLQLAVGTVKSHTHNILKKTNQKSREELIRNFWRNQ